MKLEIYVIYKLSSMNMRWKTLSNAGKDTRLTIYMIMCDLGCGVEQRIDSVDVCLN